MSRETRTACDKCGSSELTQETDVLDTWFSERPASLYRLRLAWGTGIEWTDARSRAFLSNRSLLVTGFDILFFWVARMVMLGCHFMLDVPMPDGTKAAH